MLNNCSLVIRIGQISYIVPTIKDYIYSADILPEKTAQANKLLR